MRKKAKKFFHTHIRLETVQTIYRTESVSVAGRLNRYTRTGIMSL